MVAQALASDQEHRQNLRIQVAAQSGLSTQGGSFVIIASNRSCGPGGRDEVKSTGSMLALIAMLGTGVAEKASACSFVMPPVEEVAAGIAARGVMFRGTVIQKFDAAKQQPEIIRADELFVGDRTIRTFVIYHPKDHYDLVLHRPVVRSSCEFVPRLYDVGDRIDLLVLEPAGDRDGLANGRWGYSIFGDGLIYGPGRDLLTRAATQAGRLQAELPQHP